MWHKYRALRISYFISPTSCLLPPTSYLVPLPPTSYLQPCTSYLVGHGAPGYDEHARCDRPVPSSLHLSTSLLRPTSTLVPRRARSTWIRRACSRLSRTSVARPRSPSQLGRTRIQPNRNSTTPSAKPTVIAKSTVIAIAMALLMAMARVMAMAWEHQII